MDKKREEMTQQIRKVFYWLNMISVSGDAVEVMAMARRELRAAQAMCNEETEKTEE
jgi:hypothetical protein